MSKRARGLAALATVIAGLAAGAAVSSGNSTTVAPRAGAAESHFAVTLTRMRGKRYCELILVKPGGSVGALVVQVWNTYPFNACPQTPWAALDLTTIGTHNGAIRVLRNGPRYWLIDGLTKFGNTRPVTKTFGSLTMSFDATIKVTDLVAAVQPYQEHQVSRDTVFRYASGGRVYELTAANGSRYVMQSYSQQIDPRLRESGLSHLGARLRLPRGWSYGTRNLARALPINTTTSPAIVLQDDLGNTYSLEHRGTARG